MAGSRKDQWLYTVSVAGRDIGTFDGKTGGKVTAESSKWRDGGMGPAVGHGSPADREDISCTRRYDFDRDHPIVGWLESQVGKGSANIKGQPLDTDGNPYGRPRAFTGTLMGVDSPESDSNDAAIGVLTLDFEADEVAS